MLITALHIHKRGLAALDSGLSFTALGLLSRSLFSVQLLKTSG